MRWNRRWMVWLGLAALMLYSGYRFVMPERIPLDPAMATWEPECELWDVEWEVAHKPDVQAAFPDVTNLTWMSAGDEILLAINSPSARPRRPDSLTPQSTTLVRWEQGAITATSPLIDSELPFMLSADQSSLFTLADRVTAEQRFADGVLVELRRSDLAIVREVELPDTLPLPNGTVQHCRWRFICALHPLGLVLQTMSLEQPNAMRPINSLFELVPWSDPTHPVVVSFPGEFDVHGILDATRTSLDLLVKQHRTPEFRALRIDWTTRSAELKDGGLPPELTGPISYPRRSTVPPPGIGLKKRWFCWQHGVLTVPPAAVQTDGLLPHRSALEQWWYRSNAGSWAIGIRGKARSQLPHSLMHDTTPFPMKGTTCWMRMQVIDGDRVREFTFDKSINAPYQSVKLWNQSPGIHLFSLDERIAFAMQIAYPVNPELSESRGLIRFGTLDLHRGNFTWAGYIEMPTQFRTMRHLGQVILVGTDDGWLFALTMVNPQPYSERETASAWALIPYPDDWPEHYLGSYGHLPPRYNPLVDTRAATP